MSRCGDGRPAHDMCPPRCMKTIPASEQQDVDNNSENTVRNVTHMVWTKPLPRGEMAVLVVNRNVEPVLDLDVVFKEIGFGFKTTDQGAVSATPSKMIVRDVYAKKDVGEFTGHFTVQGVKPHDSRMFRLRPAAM